MQESKIEVLLLPEIGSIGGQADMIVNVAYEFTKLCEKNNAKGEETKNE